MTAGGTGAERRKKIVGLLANADGPLSGSALARELGVSRQVIVQDIALIRADGTDVVSTNRGYVLDHPQSGRPTRLFKVHHGPDEVGEEMNAVVDLGGTMIDTLVNHRTYGVMRAPLGVSSRKDVKDFLDDLASSRSSLLSEITSGYHFHHVSADSEETLDQIEDMLCERGWLVEMTDYERKTMR